MDDEVLDRVRDLPSETELVADLGLSSDLAGWDAVHAVVAQQAPQVASYLGRNGVAWEAHTLLGDPGTHLAAVAEAGRHELADTLFAQLTERGWARPVGEE